MKKFLLLSVLLFVFTGCATSHTVGADEIPADKTNNLLQLPHITANRTTKRIEIDGYTTTINKKDIVEFILIAEPSGNGYEALTMSKVKPSDVHKALVFIGMQPGNHVDPANLRFWPKGERVTVSIICKTSKFGDKPVRSEKFVYNERTGKSMEEIGFVFTGSMWLPDPENPEKELYAANVREPNAILANYNEIESVFDIPRQAPKSDVYRSLLANPDNILPTNAPVTIVIEPEYKDGKTRIKDLTLTMSPGLESDSAPEKILFTLINNANGAVLHDKVGLKDIAKTFSTLVEDGHDPFVVTSFADDLTIAQINNLCKMLASIETERGIRIEPPPAGCLYYRAFIPSEKNRDRSNRIVQPWELHLNVKDNKVSGTLIAIDEEWDKNKLTPNLSFKKYHIANNEALKTELEKDATMREQKKKPARMNVILLFAPGTLTHLQLMEFIKPIMPKKPIIHVYLEE